MTDIKNRTNQDTNSIDNRELACMSGHKESRQRLLESPRMDQKFVEQYETAVDSYEEFARGVLSEIRYMRDEE